MVAPHDAHELCRVLKPGGWAILEKIGEKDKRNIKLQFERDASGNRGQFSDDADGQRAARFAQELSSCFDTVEVREGLWRTYYSLDGLVMMLEQTPTVRGFDRHADTDALRRVVDTCGTNRGIETTQHRILITARKKQKL
jgi:hypothetical protein